MNSLCKPSIFRAKAALCGWLFPRNKLSEYGFFLTKKRSFQTRVTFPDTTFEQTTYTAMEATQTRDRLGRLTTTRFNALRQPVFVEDALGRVLRWTPKFGPGVKL